MKKLFAILFSLSMLSGNLLLGQESTSTKVETAEPSAMVSFMGKEGSNTITLDKVRQAVGLLAKPVAQDSKALYIVQSFKLSIGSNSGAVMSFETMENYGAKLSDASLAMLKNVKVGDVLMLDNVMVKVEGGADRAVPAKGAKLKVVER